MASNVRFLDNVSVGSYGGGGNSISASYAETASFAQSGNGPFTGSFTGSFFGNGEGIFSGSMSGSITHALTAKSASHAIIADSALSASYASYALSASHEIVKEVSSSFADTASYVNPLQQNVDVTGNIEATGVISASKFTVNSGSSALLPGYTFHHDSGTGLYSANAGDLQFQLAGGGTPEISLTTGQATFRVPIQLNNNELINPSRIRGLGSISASGDISSSITSTSSFGTYLGDGSQLTGVDGFPFIGDAQITGSLNISGSVNIAMPEGSAFTIKEDDAGDPSRFDFSFTNGDPLLRIKGEGSSVTSSLELKDDTSSFFINSDGFLKYVIGATTYGVQFTSEFKPIDTTGAVPIGFKNRRWADLYLYKGKRISFGNNNLASSNQQMDIVHTENSGRLTLTGSYGAHLDIKGAISASAGIINPLTASYAMTASHALNGGEDAFPFTGDAQITGSLIVSGSAEFRGTENKSTNVVLGPVLGATSANSVIIGNGAGIAFGGGNNTAIGDSAIIQNNTQFGTAVGKSSSVTGTAGIAYGYFATAAGESIAIGRSANAAAYGLAIGKSVTAASSQLAIGYENTTISASFTTGHVILSGSTGGLELIGSGSTMFEVIGSEGTLFEVTDSLTGSIFAAKDATGIPILEVFANGGNNDTVEVNQAKLLIDSGSLEITGSIDVSGSILNNLSASYALTASHALNSLTANAGTTTNRVAFTTAGGELTTEAGFEYNPTTNQLTVDSINAISFTSSFITSSTIQSSGSHIFGDEVTDTQTLVGSILMSGSAELTGSLALNQGNIRLNATTTAPTSNAEVVIGADSATSVKVLKIASTAGYLEIGPQNGSYCHFYTDIDKFYFNKPIQVAGEVMSHNGSNLVLGSNGGTSDTITIGTNDIIFELNNNNIFHMTTGSAGLDATFSGSATSTASFGTYLGDGSQLTGLSSGGTNLTQSIFVTQNGDDTTGTIGNISKPFATLESASQAATTGSTIFVYPGTYTVTENLAREGVNYYFQPGTTVSSSYAGAIFDVEGFRTSPHGFNVYGNADFHIHTNNSARIWEAGANFAEVTFDWTLEFQDATNTANGTLIKLGTQSQTSRIKFRNVNVVTGFISNEASYQDSGILKIEGNKFESSGGSFYTGGGNHGPYSLQVDVNWINCAGSNAFDNMGYSRGLFNVAYCYSGGTSYAYNFYANPGGEGYQTAINGHANRIKIAGIQNVQQNGDCGYLEITNGNYTGNNVKEATISGGTSQFNWVAGSYLYSPISISGGVAIITCNDAIGNFPQLDVSGGKCILLGYMSGGLNSRRFGISGGELIFKGYVEGPSSSNTANYGVFRLTSGILRIQGGYIKSMLKDGDVDVQNSSPIRYEGGELILDNATLISSGSIVPPVRVIGQDREVKIYSGGVNTNKTGSMGLLAASSSFGSGGYALTNPLGGMIIEDSSVE